MPSCISISLANSATESYIPGSVVTGCVTVFLTQPKKVKNITLFAYGEEKTSFHFQSVLSCASEKKIFEYYFILWKPINGDNEIMPAGKQIFKFSFKLPSKCLPNFQGEYGSIRYFIKAKVDVLFNFDYKCEILFFVKSCFPSLIIGNKMVKQNFIQKFSNGTEIINVEFIINKKHYILGETIQLVTNINNQSKFTIDSIETGIQTSIIYKGKATDSWRGKYFEATENETFNSLTKKNKLFINAGQKYDYKRSFELEKLHSSISDNLINVKHEVFIKLYLKKSSEIPLTFFVPIKIYTTSKNPKEPLIPKFISTVSESSNSSGNNTSLINHFNPEMLNDPPPAYSEIDNLKSSASINLLRPLHPPKYE